MPRPARVAKTWMIKVSLVPVLQAMIDEQLCMLIIVYANCVCTGRERAVQGHWHDLSSNLRSIGDWRELPISGSAGKLGDRDLIDLQLSFLTPFGSCPFAIFFTKMIQHAWVCMNAQHHVQRKPSLLRHTHRPTHTDAHWCTDTDTDTDTHT